MIIVIICDLLYACIIKLCKYEQPILYCSLHFTAAKHTSIAGRGSPMSTSRLGWIELTCINELNFVHDQAYNRRTHVIPPLHSRVPMHDHGSTCMCMHRIAGIFRGYKCSGFSWIRDVTQAFITPKLNIACMHAAKTCYSTKIKSGKTFPLI